MAIRVASICVVAALMAAPLRAHGQAADTAPRATTPTTVSDSDYPLASLLANEEGRVVLAVAVDATGAVTDAQVQTLSGFARLDQISVMIAKSRWHFQPAARNGQPVAGMAQVPVAWTLPLKPYAGNALDIPALPNGAQLPKPVPGSNRNVTISDPFMMVGEQGVVGVKYMMRQDGTISDAQVAASSGIARLDDAAARLVTTHWKPEPATVNGRPVAAWRDVSVAFTGVGQNNANALLHCYAQPILAHESVLIRAEPVVMYYSQMNMEPVMAWRARAVDAWLGLWLQVSNAGTVTDALVGTEKGWMHLSAPLVAQLTRGRLYPAGAGNACWYYDPVMITG